MLCLSASGCQGVYNATLEHVFGYEKRDLLQKSVQAVKKDQVKAEEHFQDAITELRQVYNYNGGDLEKMYEKIKKAYEDSKDRADTVHKRVDNMDRIANSMFSEWSKEIKQYQNRAFAEDSRRKLDATKERYASLIKSARSSEDAMKPVLTRLHDHELYLKHNLNAASLGALQGEAAGIQSDVEELTNKMNDSIREADAFIQLLNGQKK